MKNLRSLRWRQLNAMNRRSRRRDDSKDRIALHECDYIQSIPSRGHINPIDMPSTRWTQFNAIEMRSTRWARFEGYGLSIATTTRTAIAPLIFAVLRSHSRGTRTTVDLSKKVSKLGSASPLESN